MAKKTLGEVADYINGKAFKSSDWEENGTPIIRIQNLTKSNTSFNRTTKKCEDKYQVKAGDLLFAWSASLGAHIWKDEDGLLNQHIFKVVPKSGTDKMYLYYYLLQIVDQLYQKTHGSGMVHITMKKFKDTPISLPPLEIQQQIVANIESLFAKLDQAKEKAQQTFTTAETRKAAILHQAFTGQLTEKWRAENGVTMEEWEEVSISDICSSLKYGTAKKSLPVGKIAVIRMGNLQNGEIDWSDLVFSDDEEDIEKYQLVPGDVLFNRTNSAALVGKTSIYRGERPAIYAGYLIKLDYDRMRILGEFLNFTLNTADAKNYCNAVKTDGVNQSNINAKKIGAYQFFLPPLSEQQEIVRILDKLLAKEQQITALAEAVLDEIEATKKSILAKAFRGEWTLDG